MKTIPGSFANYQRVARTFAIYPPDRIGEVPVYPALGLVEEAGEVAGKLKKIIRDKNGEISIADLHGITAELGDVLWYIAALCTELHVDLEEVAEQNLAKLRSRQQRGTIGGAGDAR